MSNELLHPSPIENRDYYSSAEKQKEITEFIDTLRSEVGNKEGYLNTCHEADKRKMETNSETLENLFTRFENLIANTSPGHDVNHIRRDSLHGLAFATGDSFVKNGFSQSDINACVLGSIYHDIGNSVVRRYEDTKYINGHAEVGAYIFFQNSGDLLEENLKKLTAYAIAAHTHYLKPISVKEPFDPKKNERQPYWYDIFYPNDDNKPCGLAPIITRFSDRLENNGNILVARTFAAYADAAETGGYDLEGKEGFFEINREKLRTLFSPEVREGKNTPPTILEHALMYAGSNFGNSHYSKDDHMFPLIRELMTIKTMQVDKLVKIVTSGVDTMNYSELPAEAIIKDTLRQVSGSKNFLRSWNVLAMVWEELNPETQLKWKNGFKYIQESYPDWLEAVAQKIGDEHKKFARKLMRECL